MNNLFRFLNVFIFITLGLYTTSCQKYTLRARTEYVSYLDLASYHVGTPDPNLCNPPTGQRLMVNWKIPTCYLKDPDLALNLTVRYCNREQANVCIPIKKTRGTYCYPLLNNRYFDTGGIRTYKVIIQGSNGIYDTLYHVLWRDLIVFDHPETDKEEEGNEEQEDEEDYYDDEDF